MVDVSLVLVFSHVGRSNHDEPVSVSGILGTAWPFLLGLALGWLVARRVAARRSSLGASSGAGRAVVMVAVLWATAMLVRLVTGQGVSGAFPLVALAMLAALLLGWRLVAVLLGRLSARGPRRSAAPTP